MGKYTHQWWLLQHCFRNIVRKGRKGVVGEFFVFYKDYNPNAEKRGIKIMPLLRRGWNKFIPFLPLQYSRGEKSNLSIHWRICEGRWATHVWLKHEPTALWVRDLHCLGRSKQLRLVKQSGSCSGHKCVSHRPTQVFQCTGCYSDLSGPHRN